jgi:hypothetical protein
MLGRGAVKAASDPIGSGSSFCCFYCQKNESESTLSNAVHVWLDKTEGLNPVRQFPRNGINGLRSPYQIGEIQSGSFQSEIGGTVSIGRRVVRAGTIAPHTGRRAMVDLLYTRVDVEVLRCNACESALKRRIGWAMGIGIGAAALISILITRAAAVAVGWDSGVAGGGFLLWVVFSIIAWVIVKVWRESSHGRVSKHPIVNAALKERFNLHRVDDGAFTRDLPSGPARQYFPD